MIHISTTYKNLYLSKTPDLIRFALRFVDAHSAEDVVQDAFLKLWDEKYEQLPEEELIKLLYTLVRNTCIDHIRHSEVVENYRDKRIVDLTIRELEQYNSFEKELIKNDLYQHVLAEIEKLPEKRRKIFELSYLEGKKSNEIADDLGLSVRTVENNLYRALAFLRQNLSSNAFSLILYFVLHTFFKPMQ